MLKQRRVPKEDLQLELVSTRPPRRPRRPRKQRGGRPRRAARPQVPHRVRPELDRRHPLHITLRMLAVVGNLRKRDAYHAVRKALLTILPRQDFRVCHLSIQGNHIHLLCEADNKLAVSRGMQALKTSAARRLNRALGRAGQVFADRYHVEVITCPRQVRSSLAYVLNNWRRHRVDQEQCWAIDPFSTGRAFTGWRESTWRVDTTSYMPLLPVSAPQTWLLSEGWMRGGTPISLWEVPGPRS